MLIFLGSIPIKKVYHEDVIVFEAERLPDDSSSPRVELIWNE